jgi:hypothetical protein
MYVHVGIWDWCAGVYPFLPTESHMSSGSMNIVNTKGERVFPYSAPLWIYLVGLLPCGVI